jgi:hypothetical protein
MGWGDYSAMACIACFGNVESMKGVYKMIANELSANRLGQKP